MSPDQLRVLHFSAFDNWGGSGRAAYRIHRGLRADGHVSHMLVRQKMTGDPEVDTVHGGGAGRIKDRLAEEVTTRLGLQDCYVPSSARVPSHPWVASADVFQLYNLHGGYFSLSLLPRLAARGAVVWRLSDMWPATGHCAYSGTCERWKTGCGHCPDLATFPPVSRDATAYLWRRKRDLYARTAMTIVAPSSWTEQLAGDSPLLSSFPVRRIPNGIDLSVFRPRDRRAMREFLDLDPDARVILFVAHSIGQDKRKGAAHLLEALRGLPSTGNVMVALVGYDGEALGRELPVPVRSFGFVAEDRLLAAIYAASDLLVAPSVSENLANSILEAMACGVPVVAFDAGGIRDAVKDLETGLLARAEDAGHLCTSIRTLLEDSELRDRLGRAARDLMEREFGLELQARRFAELYREVLERRRADPGAPTP